MGLKHELQNIISGISHHAEKNLIQTAAHHIRESKKTSGNPESQEFSKEQETKKLIDWIYQQDFWYTNHDESRFIASGAEQRVYLDSDERYVYKLNDSIFYKCWLDYFYSLLIHNYFFPSTSYELVGFHQNDNILHAVVKQRFIEVTETTDTEYVKRLLNENGFKLRKNNDYYNSDLGLILEDLHDENVLTNDGVLFFVDTVFYLEKSFFNS